MICTPHHILSEW